MQAIEAWQKAGELMDRLDKIICDLEQLSIANASKDEARRFLIGANMYLDLMRTELYLEHKLIDLGF